MLQLCRKVGWSGLGLMAWFLGVLLLMVCLAVEPTRSHLSAALTLMLAGIFPGMVERNAEPAVRPSRPRLRLVSDTERRP